MTQESLAAPARSRRWIDQTFLWITSSLTVVVVAAAFTAAVGRWPDRAAQPRRAAHAGLTRISRPAPAPLIAFGDPVPGYPVISPFGLRQLPWEEAGRLHKGVDIAAPSGSPVLAAADGVVLRTGVDPGYGRFMEIGHAAGMTTLYGHLSAFVAKPGTAVKEGQTIGRMGSTGSSTGSHLHFEVHGPQGHALNPEMFMGKSFLTRADLPLKAAERMPRGVRVAYVSYIPLNKEMQLLARQDARAEAREKKIRPKSPPPTPVSPSAKLELAAAESPQEVAATLAPAAAPVVTSSPGVQVVDPGPDGRVHGQIQPGG